MLVSDQLSAYWIEFSKWKTALIYAKEHRTKPPKMPVPNSTIAPLVEEEFRHRQRLSDIWTHINSKEPS